MGSPLSVHTSFFFSVHTSVSSHKCTSPPLPEEVVYKNFRLMLGAGMNRLKCGIPVLDVGGKMGVFGLVHLPVLGVPRHMRVISVSQ